jgi:hypothetical protein
VHDRDAAGSMRGSYQMVTPTATASTPRIAPFKPDAVEPAQLSARVN